MQNTRNKTIFKYQDLVAFAALGTIAVLLCWKAKYSFGEDDSFYLGFPQRLLQGDSLFVDEWHVTQLFALFLMLPMKIYTSIVGSTEGIILVARYFFVFCEAIIATIIYKSFRNYGVYSIAAAAIYFLHVPGSVNFALYYWSLALIFMVLTMLMMLSIIKKRSAKKLFILGILFSFTVLCNPVLCVPYIVYSVFVLISVFLPRNDILFTNNNSGKRENPYHYSKKRKRILSTKIKQCLVFIKTNFNVKTWLWISLGISFIATFVFVFLFSRTNMKELSESIPFLFTDPEYNIYENNIFSLFQSFALLFMLSPVLFFLTCIVFLFLIFDKNKMEHRSVYLVIAALAFIIYVVRISFFDEVYSYFYWMYPLVPLGLLCYILTINKNKNLFVFGYLSGIAFALSMDIASDCGIAAGIFGLTATDIVSVILIGNLISEMQIQSSDSYNKKSNKLKNVVYRMVVPMLFIALVAQISLEIYVNTDIKNTAFEYIYEAKSNELKITLNRGPEKGCITTNLKSEQYYKTLDDLSEIKAYEKGPVFIADNMTWCYLYLDFPYATYSTWLYGSELKGNFPRLLSYYKINPNKIPRYIYIPKPIYISSIDDRIYTTETVEEIFGIFAEKFVYSVIEGDAGYILKDVTMKSTNKS